MEISTIDVTAVLSDEQIQNKWEGKVTKHKIPSLWCEAGVQIRKQVSHGPCYSGRASFSQGPNGELWPAFRPHKVDKLDLSWLSCKYTPITPEVTYRSCRVQCAPSGLNRLQPSSVWKNSKQIPALSCLSSFTSIQSLLINLYSQAIIRTFYNKIGTELCIA